MSGITAIVFWFELIISHFWMIFEKLWQLLRMFFSWMGSFFSSTWNYEFLKHFSYVIFAVFVVALLFYLASYFLKDFEWIRKNEGFKNLLWSSKFNWPIAFIAKWWVIIVVFIIMYISTSNVIGRILASVSTVKEDWFIIDLKHEEWVNDTNVDWKVRKLSWYLSSIEFPWYWNSATWNDNSNAEYGDKSIVLYKEINLDKTKVAFSTDKRAWTWTHVLPYKAIMSSLSSWTESWEIINWNWNLYFMQMWDFLRRSKEYVTCWTWETKINITNLWSDIYSAIVDSNPRIKDDKKSVEQLFLTTNKISEVFNESKNNYLILSKDNIKEILNGDKKWLTYAENIYQIIARNLICVPEKIKEREPKVPNTPDNKTQAWNDNKDIPDGTKLIEWGSNFANQLEKTNNVLENVLYLQRYSLSNLNEAKTKETKFLLLSSIVDEVLRNNNWYSWLSYSHTWSWTASDNEVMIIRPTDYNALSLPFLIDLTNGDKVINYWICSYYVFDNSFERVLKSVGLWYMISFLNVGCWERFGWLYDYKNNDIDALGKWSYQKWVDLVAQWSLAKSEGRQNMSWDEAYINYWFFQRVSESWRQQVYSPVKNDIVSTPYAQSYQHQVDQFSFFVSLLNVIKTLFFSFFVYFLPGIFLAILYKIIKA